MSVDLYPLQVLLTALAGWMNRQQQALIAYLAEENRVLKEQREGRRVQARRWPRSPAGGEGEEARPSRP